MEKIFSCIFQKPFHSCNYSRWDTGVAACKIRQDTGVVAYKCRRGTGVVLNDSDDNSVMPPDTGAE